MLSIYYFMDPCRKSIFFLVLFILDTTFGIEEFRSPLKAVNDFVKFQIGDCGLARFQGITKIIFK